MSKLLIAVPHGIVAMLEELRKLPDDEPDRRAKLEGYIVDSLWASADVHPRVDAQLKALDKEATEAHAREVKALEQLEEVRQRYALLVAALGPLLAAVRAEANSEDYYASTRITMVWERFPDELKVLAECEHGKGMADYCQPCGRVNGGGP